MKAQAGFTLIELLVSLTLLGLLFVLLFGGLRFGMRAWEHGTTTTDAVDSVRLVQDLLRGEIERSCPRLLAAEAQDTPRVKFAGTVTQLRFLGPAPDAAGGQRCQDLTLEVKSDGKLQRLVLELRAGVNRGATDLLRHAQSVELAYLTEDGVWMSGWNGQTALPGLVRLRITFPKGDARAWPELFIAPRISAEADCTYDPATKSCRGG